VGFVLGDGSGDGCCFMVKFHLTTMWVCLSCFEFEMGSRENGVELLQRCQRDRRVLLKFVLSGGLIKELVLPPGAVSLDDVHLDQVSVDYVLNCIEKGCGFRAVSFLSFLIFFFLFGFIGFFLKLIIS